MSTPPFDPQQPPAPQQPAGGYPAAGIPPQFAPTAPAAPVDRKRTMGIVALALAVVGFILAVIPGVMVVAWVLLPVAFILALVTLFLKDQKKGLAIAALIVSVVGTIVGLIATLVVTAIAINEATGGNITVAPVTSADSTGGSSSGGPDASGDLGTRENPYPLGSAISNDEWTVAVNSFTADATDQVLAENPYNEKPADGTAYGLINVSITRNGEDAQSPLFVSVEYVTSGGNVVSTTDSGVVAPDALDWNELYPGATATGNIVLPIPVGDDGVLRVSPGILADEVFVATR